MKLALALACRLISIDGDTLAYCDERIRLMGYDTPELHSKCAHERRLAQKAKARLQELLDRNVVRLEHSGRRGRYGRSLARLYVVRGWREIDVGRILIQEGLARPYSGGRREPWC